MTAATRALVQHSTASIEHYSPAIIVEPGRALLRGIELDPASCALANETVRAERFYTRADDGLTKSWRAASVWCNPPGGVDDGGSVQKAWWWRAIRGWSDAEFEWGLFVCFNLGLLQTTQIGPEGLLPLDFPICYPARRVPYNIAEEEESKVAQPSLFAVAAPAFVPTVKAGKQPPAPSAIVFLPRRADVDERHARRALRRADLLRFRELYSPVGRCVWPREAW